MARFLSPEWLEELARATAGAAAQPRDRDVNGVSLTVRQVVRDGPDGDVTYAVRLGEGVVTVMPGHSGSADIEVSSDYDTAVLISKGDLSPAVALASGALKVSGRVGLLVEHRDALAGLGDVLGPGRVTTEY